MPLTLVDMPGYGYAKAPKKEVKKWQSMLRGYLRGRPGLTRAFVLIDARHGVLAADEEMFDLLDEAAVTYQLVLTKIDKIKPAELSQGLRGQPKRSPRSAPPPFPSSMPPRAKRLPASPSSAPKSQGSYEASWQRAAIRSIRPSSQSTQESAAMTDIPITETARILSEALPFLQRYDDQIIVVKYGGHAMVDPELARQFARDMVMLKVCGINPIVVHGGGPQINRMLDKLAVKAGVPRGPAGHRPGDHGRRRNGAGGLHQQIDRRLDPAGRRPRRRHFRQGRQSPDRRTLS